MRLRALDRNHTRHLEQMRHFQLIWISNASLGAFNFAYLKHLAHRFTQSGMTTLHPLHLIIESGPKKVHVGVRRFVLGTIYMLPCMFRLEQATSSLPDPARRPTTAHTAKMQRGGAKLERKALSLER